ncbi:MFS transporter [Kitasatospora phosalacinea]|uniref:MFS transporter n=1 Tax=Kitasatospora phosalacinea TaxID=2065 RepID=UPI000691436B|nr:MFS transporter [Kitasatospora phosalacinea]
MNDRVPVQHRRSWRAGVVAGMASYVDAAAIVSTGTALVIYQGPLHLSAGQVGALSGTLTAAIATGALLGGRLGDRFGRRRVFTATMAMVVVGCALMVLSTGFAPLLLGTLVLGLGSGADLPVALAMVSESATDRTRAALLGFSNVLWGVGAAAAGVVAAVVGGWGRAGGQLLYGHVGAIALLLVLARLSLPESPVWLTARRERSPAPARLLLRGRHLRPFAALLGFYALTNLAANTSGQFGAYVAVNVAGLPVDVGSRLSLLVLPVTVAAGLWFMRIAGTPRRMAYFASGGACLTGAYLVPPLFGFSLATLALSAAVNAVGGAFAFEGIMKTWAQESFPTLLRATAQGTVIAAARYLAAAFALVTPALLRLDPSLLYAGLAAVSAAGLAVGWLGFRGARRDEFAAAARPVQLRPTRAAAESQARVSPLGS